MNPQEKYNVAVIGDSHSLDFLLAKKWDLAPDNINIEGVCSRAGKTAQGLAKPLNRKLFLKAIQTYKKPIDYLIVMLGEVDCGYALWSRQQRHHTTQLEEIEFATDQLILFGKEAKEVPVKQIIYAGPIVPLIDKYDIDVPIIIKCRQEVPTSWKQRTNLVLKFNRILERKARDNEFLYMDINHILINPQTGLVRQEYRDTRNFHHLAHKIGAKLWIEKIEDVINTNL